MAWRNIWRNPRRSILTICAIAFASLLLVFMLSWQFGSYDTMINASVKISTGHIQIQSKDYQEKRDMRLVVRHPKKLDAFLQKTPEVASHTSRANAFSLVSSENRTYGVMVIGIDPANEARVSTLKKIVRQGSYLSIGDWDQALLGTLLAKNLQVDLGDELVILGQGLDGSVAATVVKIKGIFSSGQDEFDRNTIHIPLKYFQDVYTMNGAVHEMVVLGKSLNQVQKIKSSVAADVENINGGGRSCSPGLDGTHPWIDSSDSDGSDQWFHLLHHFNRSRRLQYFKYISHGGLRANPGIRSPSRRGNDPWTSGKTPYI